MRLPAEQSMWQSVVYRAFMDALMPDARNVEQRNARDSAISWIKGCGRDFRDVCEMAGLDPHFLSDAFKNGKVSREKLKAMV